MSTRKGKKAVKGIPLFHDEVKQTHGIKLTDTAWKKLGEIAKALKISRSELVERIARGDAEAIALLTQSQPPSP
jgi:hypothetical protein